METTKKSKTVFVEYSYASKGQHFMTVVQNMDHKRIIIGRIFREYDPEAKKTKYLATDYAGNQVFADYKDLTAIKKQYIECGETMARSIPALTKNVKQNEKMVLPKVIERKTEIKNIREKKPTKEKTKENVKTNTKVKGNPDQKEKEEDTKNTVKYKDNEPIKDENNSKTVPESPIESKESERNTELENIRDGKEDEGKEQEQEMELDM
jgi:hypothetical protein